NYVSMKAHESVDDYVKLRRNTGAVQVTFNFIEIALNIELPDKVYNDPSFQCLMDNCNDHACFINDIYSLKKELLVGDTDNLILVLKILSNYSLQEAVNDAVKLANQRVIQIRENISNLSDFGPEMNKIVNMYSEALIDWLAGSFYWHQISGRYAVGDHATRKYMESYLEPILAHDKKHLTR
ncbi:21665_t:CDS:1, partial [Racocetra persica]